MLTVHPTVERFIQMVHSEYREMPGLELTKPQISRFLGIDAITCDVVVELLESQKFLKRTSRDAYVLHS
jgi:hypothetical protein